MNLLLVDDDKIIVEGMPKAFPWQEWGIRRFLTAYSAREARGILKRERIDILLCDIEMPMESGIGLIEWVRENCGEAPEIILLTCHSEFRYARKALQLGCSNYLLKPAEEQELKEAIGQAKAGIEAKSAAGQLIYAGENRAGETRFWELLLHRQLPDGDLCLKSCESYRIDPGRAVIPVLLQIRYRSERIASLERELLSFIFENVVREMIPFRVSAVINDCNERLWLILEDPLPGGAGDAFRKLTEWFYEHYQCAVSVFLGNPVLPENFTGETDFLLDKNERNVVTPFVYGRNRDCPGSSVRCVLPKSDSDQAALLFEEGRYEELSDHLSRYFGKLTPEKCSRRTLLEFTRRLDRKLQETAFRAGWSFFYALQEKLWYDQRGCDLSTAAVSFYYRTICSEMGRASAEAEAASVTVKAKQYIELNLSTELTREGVARYLGFNPDYLNRLFKKETGVSLRRYISEEKLSLASRLLSDTGLSVSEIGSRVGYRSLSSFSTWFKGMTGITPASWRAAGETPAEGKGGQDYE